jgi:GAF domain-containing protein
MTNTVNILAAVPRDEASRYHKHFSGNKEFRLQLVSDKRDVLNTLSDLDKHVDVLVLDNRMGDTFELIGDVRHSYPRLFIILVDEEADFGLPGQADDITTAPFENNDLIKSITRLMSDRQLETLRADSLPAVRAFAKHLRKASGEYGKQEAAVAACMDMDYQYVAFYRLESLTPPRLTLNAQDGLDSIKGIAPKTAGENDLMAWVAQSGKSRVAGSADDPTHPLVKGGHLGAVACVPVNFSGNRYGVIAACREVPGSITQEDVIMLELVSAQLAAAISKEIVS